MLNLYRHIRISIVNCAIAKSFGGKIKLSGRLELLGGIYILFSMNSVYFCQFEPFNEHGTELTNVVLKLHNIKRNLIYILFTRHKSLTAFRARNELSLTVCGKAGILHLYFAFAACYE